MTKDDELRELKTLRERAKLEIDKLRDQLREARYKLDHFRRAVAAVKWLWDRANEQQPFQL